MLTANGVANYSVFKVSVEAALIFKTPELSQVRSLCTTGPVEVFLEDVFAFHDLDESIQTKHPSVLLFEKEHGFW